MCLTDVPACGTTDVDKGNVCTCIFFSLLCLILSPALISRVLHILHYRLIRLKLLNQSFYSLSHNDAKIRRKEASNLKIQGHALSACIDYAFFSTFMPQLSFLQPAAKSVSDLCVFESSLNLIKRLLT